MKNKRILRIITLLMAGFMILSSLLSIFAVSANAAGTEIEWRMVNSAPELSFRDPQGNLIPELEAVPADSPDLQLDAAYVALGDGKKQRYSSVDIHFAYADYSYTVDQDEINLPDSDRMIAELKCGNQLFSAQEILCSATPKNYLKVDLYFERIVFQEDALNEMELFIQYFRKSIDGDEESTPSKGSVTYTLEQLNDDTPEEEDQLNIQIVLPETEEAIPDDVVPYILVDECVIENGWTAVAAGSSFTLNLTCRNSHDQIDLENILLQVDVPEGLKLEHPSDTFYIGNIGDEERFQHSLNFSTALGMAVKNYDVVLKFSYEYLEGEKRKSDSISIGVQIPVYQPTHFVADPLDILPEYEVNKTHELCSSFANMTRGNIYNVTATLITDANCSLKVLHLGNLSAGEGGAAVFEIAAEEEGFENAEVLYTYETEQGQVQEERVTCLLKFVLPEDETATKEVVKYVTDISGVESNSSKMQLYLTMLGMMFLAAALGYALKQDRK